MVCNGILHSRSDRLNDIRSLTRVNKRESNLEGLGDGANCDIIGVDVLTRQNVVVDDVLWGEQPGELIVVDLLAIKSVRWALDRAAGDLHVTESRLNLEWVVLEGDHITAVHIGGWVSLRGRGQINESCVLARVFKGQIEASLGHKVALASLV